MTAPAGWGDQLPPAGSWERDTTTLPALTDDVLAEMDQQHTAVPAEATPPPAPAPAPDPAPVPDPAPEPTPSRKARRMAAEQQTAPAAFEAGQLVTYRHPDPITGQDLHGAGVVVHVGDSEGAAVVVAPCSPQYLEVLPENLTAAAIGSADSTETA